MLLLWPKCNMVIRMIRWYWRDNKKRNTWNPHSRGQLLAAHSATKPTDRKWQWSESQRQSVHRATRSLVWSSPWPPQVRSLRISFWPARIRRLSWPDGRGGRRTSGGARDLCQGEGWHGVLGWSQWAAHSPKHLFRISLNSLNNSNTNHSYLSLNYAELFFPLQFSGVFQRILDNEDFQKYYSSSTVLKTV